MALKNFFFTFWTLKPFFSLKNLQLFLKMKPHWRSLHSGKKISKIVEYKWNLQRLLHFFLRFSCRGDRFLEKCTFYHILTHFTILVCTYCMHDDRIKCRFWNLHQKIGNSWKPCGKSMESSSSAGSSLKSYRFYISLNAQSSIVTMWI